MAEPVTLTGVQASIEVDGKVTALTIETTYTPEKDDAGNVTRISNGSFVVKNSDGDELVEYNGTSNTFSLPPDSKASSDLIRQISDYQTGKQSPGIKSLVLESAQQIADDSNIKISK